MNIPNFEITLITALFNSGGTIDYSTDAFSISRFYEDLMEDVKVAHECDDELEYIEVRLLFDAKQLF